MNPACPARAGMDRTPPSKHLPPPGLPRTRGDGMQGSVISARSRKRSARTSSGSCSDLTRPSTNRTVTPRHPEGPVLALL